VRKISGKASTMRLQAPLDFLLQLLLGDRKYIDLRPAECPTESFPERRR
jgi:hypothetical protein